MACDYVGVRLHYAYPCLYCKGQVCRVVLVMSLGSPNCIPPGALLAVAFWMFARTLAMAVAEYGTARDSFGQFAGALLLSLLVCPVVTLLLSS